MLIWGSKGEIADLGVQASMHCPTCEKERSFRQMLQYKVHHVWYLFKWVTQKQYMLVCDVCHRGAKLDAKDVESKLTKNPIPFMSRFGWTFLVALLAIGFVATKIEGQQRDTRTEDLIHSPQANDLYVMNVASLLKNPESSSMYGVLRVKSAQAGRIEFEVPTVTYNKSSGPSKDIRNGKIADAGYFAQDAIAMPAAEIDALRASGAIYSVERPGAN